MRRIAVVATVVAISTFSWIRGAQAYEHQFHLGGSFGYAALPELSDSYGFAGRVHLDYGLSDLFNLMSKVELDAFPGSSARVVPSTTVGAGVVLDRFQVIPSLGIMAGVADLWSSGSQCVSGCHLPKFDLELPLGIDYMISRSVAVGLLGRYQLLLGDGPLANLFTISVKAEYVWGF